MSNEHRLAFEDAVREHGGMVRRLAASYEASPSLRDDLVQDIWLALWRALEGYRGESGLKTYVARIAHNVAVSHVRRDVSRRRAAAVELSPALVDVEQDPERDAGRALERERLLNAVRDLPLSLRQPVSLQLEGLDNAEIAEALGLSKGNVAVRLTRARTALAERMRGEA